MTFELYPFISFASVRNQFANSKKLCIEQNPSFTLFFCCVQKKLIDVSCYKRENLISIQYSLIFFSPSVIEIIPFEKKPLAQLSCCECKQILWTDFTDLKCSHQKMLCSEMTRLKDRYNNSNF